jgi:hypothetical protein
VITWVPGLRSAGAADVVEVRVGEDQVADRAAGREVKVAKGGPHPSSRGSGVDSYDAVAGGDEGEVAEVVALGDVHVWFGPPDPGRGEAEAVLGGDPVAAELQLGAGGEGAET